MEQLKQLELIRHFVPPPQNSSAAGDNAEGNFELDVETQKWKERILQDAEQTAENMIRQAREEADRIRELARKEADDWWQSRRSEDEAVAEQARQQGYANGYESGAAQAESDLREEWETRLKEAEELVRLGYVTKEKVIAEAETFVVDLSCSIADKLVGDRLAESPELAVKLYAQALARRKEQGVITLCVAPNQFSFVQAARDELVMSLDSQAELQIVPDPSVGEGGCIVRSSFGSIDARIDTQLSTIRAELLRVAAFAAEEGKTDAAS